MANHFRAGVPESPSVFMSITNNGDGTFREIGASNFNTGDVVRVEYVIGAITYGFYALCIDGAADTFSFDKNIYKGVPASFNAVGGLFKTTEYFPEDIFRIDVDIQQGSYSKQYIKYSSSTSYKLILPNNRRNLYGSDTIGELLEYEETTSGYIPQLCYVDECGGAAYGVSFTEGTFDIFNNRFKSTIEFNIATR